MDHVFLVENYATERVKTLSVWSHFRDEDLAHRIEPRARTPHEHFVHQCVSEDAWMRTMLGIETSLPALPERETRVEFLRHYAAASEARLNALGAKDGAWFDGTASFFGVERSRAWILVRRLTHSAHHRGQLTMLLRELGSALYSTYGPTADTGGLAANGAVVVYRSTGVEDLLRADAGEDSRPALPGPGTKSVSERRG